MECMECVRKGRQYLITAPEWVMVPLLGHSGVSTVMRSQHPLTYSPAQGVGGTPRGVSWLMLICHYHANFMSGRLPELIERITNEWLHEHRACAACFAWTYIYIYIYISKIVRHPQMRKLAPKSHVVPYTDIILAQLTHPDIRQFLFLKFFTVRPDFVFCSTCNTTLIGHPPYISQI